MSTEDWADHHVARWRDHWLDVPFDDDTGAILVRMSRIIRHLEVGGRNALKDAGIDRHIFQTLHYLIVREPPGEASPGELARDLGISAAGMTGRLDVLEQAGWIQRIQDKSDRRRITVKAMPAGIEIWRSAMRRRREDDDNVLGVLTPSERGELAELLKKVAVRFDDEH